MSGLHVTPALQILIIGIAVVAAALIKGLSERFLFPAMAGYLLIGFVLRLADGVWGFMSPTLNETIALLANLGIVALLFDVGLTSNPSRLAEKLPTALLIWVGNMIAAFLAGFVAVYVILDMSVQSAFLVGTALTATSVGVAVGVWRDAGKIDSPTGELTLDVAELDDIGGVALMALAFALIPLQLSDGIGLLDIASPLGLFAVKFLGFAAFCFVFSRYLEKWLTSEFERFEAAPEYMVTVAGVGFIIASLAGWLGFSLAIGALFAGLVFSHDRKAVRTERSFRDLYAFFTPFFFINIGYHVEPGALTDAAGIGAVLLVAAVLGKLVGIGLPAWWKLGAGGGLLIAVSMIPRAEIAMIVIDQGRQLGEHIVSDQLYAGMVLVSAVTCLVTPLVLRPLMKKIPAGGS